MESLSPAEFARRLAQFNREYAALPQWAREQLPAFVALPFRLEEKGA